MFNQKMENRFETLRILLNEETPGWLGGEALYLPGEASPRDIYEVAFHGHNGLSREASDIWWEIVGEDWEKLSEVKSFLKEKSGRSA